MTSLPCLFDSDSPAHSSDYSAQVDKHGPASASETTAHELTALTELEAARLEVPKAAWLGLERV